MISRAHHGWCADALSARRAGAVHRAQERSAGRDGPDRAALGYRLLPVDTYDEVLAMGVLLGIAGASFGVALSLGSGWFPAKYKGLAMGIAGAGNSGTVLAVLFAPPLAHEVRLAGRVRHRRLHHDAAHAGDVAHGQGAAGPSKPDTCASTSAACSRRTAGPSA
jgi:hypothetical protein